MTVFWKPIQPNKQCTSNESLIKHLGHGLYELWARCDVCHRSDPFDRFARLHKGEFTASICETCAEDRHTVQHLVDDGWRP